MVKGQTLKSSPVVDPNVKVKALVQHALDRIKADTKGKQLFKMPTGLAAFDKDSFTRDMKKKNVHTWAGPLLLLDVLTFK